MFKPLSDKEKEEARKKAEEEKRKKVFLILTVEYKDSIKTGSLIMHPM